MTIAPSVRKERQDSDAGTADVYLDNKIITVLPRAVRDGQNPLPHKWLDHHGGTSRNSGRSNEAGEAARKSEREAEPSAASPQITRNGRCRGRSPRQLDAQRRVQRNTKNSYEHWSLTRQNER